MPQGRNYINKHYFILDEGWTADAVSERLEEMGLRIHRDQSVLTQQTLDRYENRPGFNLMIYTHNTKDDPAEIRRSIVSRSDSEWYLSRGWEPVPAHKMEIPY
ncbi:MAG: hypothetical protein ACRC6V_09950 [Bacteroidales bacterium]